MKWWETEDMKLRKEIFTKIDIERKRQQEKFGIQKWDLMTFNAILNEEVGEVARALIEFKAKGSIPDGELKFDESLIPDLHYGHILKELIQVAAVAIGMIEYLHTGEY